MLLSLRLYLNRKDSTDSVEVPATIGASRKNLFIFYSDPNYTPVMIHGSILHSYLSTVRQTDEVKTAPAALEWTEMIRTGLQ